MIPLLEIALSNVLVAALLAMPAMLSARRGRRPALTHALWVLVLLKLVTPPLFRVPIVWPETASTAATAEIGEPSLPADAAAELPVEVPTGAIEWPPPPTDVPVPLEPAPVADEIPPPAPPPVEPETPTPLAAPEAPLAWTTWLCLPWLAGSVGWLFVTARRLGRFQRLLRFARPAPADAQAEADALSDRLGIRALRVLTLPGPISPMLWAAGGAPRLLLPEELLGRITASQRATLLAHELAHLRRGDHRVRWLEVLALALYWWCPLAWWARAQLRQAEEECCDAWVVALLPDSARTYALALVETIDFLSGAPAALPPAASGIGHVRLLRRRLTMILHGSTQRSLPRAGLLALVGLGLLLPFVPSIAQPPPTGPIAEPNEAPKVAGDPAVQKEQGNLAVLQHAADIRRKEEVAMALLAQQLELDKLEVQRKALQAKQRDVLRRIERLKQVGAAAPKATGAPAAGPGGKAASTDQRLDQIERKLDALLWEVDTVRRELARKHVAPSMPGGPAGGIPHLHGGQLVAPPYGPLPGIPGSNGTPGANPIPNLGGTRLIGPPNYGPPPPTPLIPPAPN